MDGASSKGRKFPAYTTAQLQAMVAAGTANQAVKDDVAARESGQSVAHVVPQMVRF